MTSRWPTTISSAVVVIAARVVVLMAMYVAGAGDVHRYHVESAAALFVAAALLVRVIRRVSEGGASSVHPRDDGGGLWSWAAFCVGAVILYAPALSIGWLSDDFGLASRAAAWNLAPVGSVLFRPLPLAVWALLLNFGAGPFLLHLLNVVLHGTAAHLTARLASAWTPDRGWQVLAGAMLLTAPLAPEAVAWCSGVFDVTAAVLVLGCVLIATRYERHASLATRAAFIALGLAAVLSKETAAVVPALAVLTQWRRRSLPRALAIDLAVLASAIAVFGLTRWLLATDVDSLSLSRYVLQRAVFAAFGGLAVPYHADVVQRLPWLSFVSATAVIALACRFSIVPGPTRDLRVVVSAVLWILISVALVVPVLVSTPDLESTRYLYLAGVGWATLIVALAALVHDERPGRVSAARLVVVTIVGLGAVATRLHLAPWREAAELRDRVEQAARTDADMRACADLSLTGLPDAVRGAFVFRNSAPEAFARDVHMTVVDRPSSSACAFRWNATSGRFESR